MTAGEYLLSKSSLITGKAIDHFMSMQGDSGGISIFPLSSIGISGVSALNVLTGGTIIPIQSGNTIEIG